MNIVICHLDFFGWNKDQFFKSTRFGRLDVLLIFSEQKIIIVLQESISVLNIFTFDLKFVCSYAKNSLAEVFINFNDK